MRGERKNTESGRRQENKEKRKKRRRNTRVKISKRENEKMLRDEEGEI